MPSMQPKPIHAAVLSLAIAAGAATGAWWGASDHQLIAPAHAQTAPATAPLVTGLPDFTQLVDAVGPAVVNIRTTEKSPPSPR